MIVKHFDINHGTCFFEGDEILCKRLQLDEVLKKYTKFLINSDNDFVKNVINECGRFENGKRADQLNQYTAAVQDLTGWEYSYINFVTANMDLSTTKDYIAVLVKDNTQKKYRVYVFNETTFLMTDDGKTIEKLI